MVQGSRLEQQAESCNQFLQKGKRVYVEGRLKSDTWEGRDGQTRFTNEIIADRVLFLDRQPVATVPGDEAYGENTGVGDEDLPF